MRFPRSSGILAHITSLPGEFVIGDLGSEAFAFVDFLAESGQTIWQVLPLNPPATGNSPYSCYSVFAGNPLLVCPRSMVQDGWLQQLPAGVVEEAHSIAADQPTHVAYEAAKRLKDTILRKAIEESEHSLGSHEGFQAFCNHHCWWLDEFARFEALMNHFKTPDWITWPAELAQRQDEALVAWDKRLASEIVYSKFVQFVIDQQWNRLRQYAKQRSVRIYGDLAIFVAYESADVWSNQSLFYLDHDGKPTLVAGVPPDYFSETGQRWGNPLYRWDVIEAEKFDWWTKRFRRAQNQFDLLRVDHFRGFESYWEIPASAETAIEGHWQKGPGAKPFEAAFAELGELPIIAEDLGMITDAVHELRDQLEFPPMRVLQFGFESEEDDFHRPNRYPEHCVAYTGTHDNETLMGWYEQREHGGSPMSLDPWIDCENESHHWQLIQLVIESAADTVIFPLQDILGLGNEARMNKPGVADGNWTWRVAKSDLTEAVASRLKELTNHSNRALTSSTL